MADIQSYERVLKKKGGRAKAIMIIVYIFILSLWLVALAKFGISPQLLLLIPLSLVAVIALTWRFTQVEYEYAFIAGIMTFSKIYGNSRRKTILEFDIKSVISVYPYNEQTALKTGTDDKSRIINGIPSKESPNPCMCVFEDSKDRKVYFLLDCDELTARIFKFFNSSATERSVLDRLSESLTQNND